MEICFSNLDVHELNEDETTSRDSSTDDVNEKEVTVTIAELEYIIINNYKEDILADKVVEVMNNQEC